MRVNIYAEEIIGPPATGIVYRSTKDGEFVGLAVYADNDAPDGAVVTWWFRSADELRAWVRQLAQNVAAGAP